MSIDLNEIQDPKRCYIGSGQELIDKIALALDGMYLNKDYDSAMETDDGSLSDIIKTSKFRKLKWTVKQGVRYALVYSYSDENKFFDQFRSKYGNELRWIQRTRKMTIDERVIVYNPTSYVEYKEVTAVDELNLFLIPSHIWDDAIREEVKNQEAENGN